MYNIAKVRTAWKAKWTFLIEQQCQQQ